MDNGNLSKIEKNTSRNCQMKRTELITLNTRELSLGRYFTIQDVVLHPKYRGEKTIFLTLTSKLEDCRELTVSTN